MPFSFPFGIKPNINKIFTSKQRGFLNETMFESNRMSYMLNEREIGIRWLVDRGYDSNNRY